MKIKFATKISGEANAKIAQLAAKWEIPKSQVVERCVLRAEGKTPMTEDWKRLHELADDIGIQEALEILEHAHGLSASTGSLFYFEDRNGREICFKGSMAIEDLVKHGVDRIAFVHPGATLRPNEWRHNGKVKSNTEVEHE